MNEFEAFRQDLTAQGVVGIRAGLIGRELEIETPFGTQPLIYADYVASGRALAQVEAFIATRVLPYYANTHTEASYCGQKTSRLREAARAEIARITGAGPEGHVVFAGAGATAGINRIVGLLRIADRVRAGERVVVLNGPYEHHSNILPWRESGAECRQVAEAAGGGVDMADLAQTLAEAQGADLIVGAFSAASNVTGILTDVDAVTRALKAAEALAIWDYAGGAPYLPMQMGEGEAAKDAIVFSPHKFPGGPGASGVLVLRDSIVGRTTPTAPGGGTVSFVSPWRHAYSPCVEVREEAGTPNVLGDIRAALAMLVKEALGEGWICAEDARLRAGALAQWQASPRIEMLGAPGAEALPIFSFRVRDGQGGYIHHQLFCRMLSDATGIQARAGCACAGPYAHSLLGLGQAASEALFNRLAHGAETEKPGWVRLNLSYLHDAEEVTQIVSGVLRVAEEAPELAEAYSVDPATARFTHASALERTA